MRIGPIHRTSLQFLLIFLQSLNIDGRRNRDADHPLPFCAAALLMNCIPDLFSVLIRGICLVPLYVGVLAGIVGKG